MSNYQIETHPALTDGSLASRSLALIVSSLNDSSLHGDWFVVSTILPRKRAILLNSPSDGVGLNNLPLPPNASTFGQIDTLKIVCQDSPGKPKLGFAIDYLCQHQHQFKLQISQFSKWYISSTQKDVALDCCDIANPTCSKFLEQLTSYLWQSFARFCKPSQNSKLLQQADRNSDTIFEAKRLDRLFDNHTAILNCWRSGTDKTLLSLYRVPALHSILEALPASSFQG
ncbi:MAG: hypothetical protein MUE44_32595 [Oscillatoriaceae cyanobacterium Prado104]|jgi:hypothetical protein|nr:hypothetical protein [Oscillatoriaceae cyanobacterium Prado104]